MQEPVKSVEQSNATGAATSATAPRGEPLNTVEGRATQKECIEEKPAAVISISDVTHYVTVVILGLLSWVLAWCACGEGWAWDGHWSQLAAVVAMAWASGQLLQSITSLPPLLAALLTGIVARHFGILDMRVYPEIDSFLRKIYPVIILGKGSLGWNLSFMKTQWRTVASLGLLPWTLEVVTMACSTKLLLGFPWIWGIMLGSFYASVSCPVLMPSVLKLQQELGCSRNWPQTVCTAGGVDTALSVGVYGLAYSYNFSNVDSTYRTVKLVLGLVVGVCAGVAWGTIGRWVPHAQDPHCTPLRVLYVLVGGLVASFLTSAIGWGGTAGVAVLACNATAAHHWSRTGWTLNRNPAATAYHVMWSACEPVLFAFTGSYVVLNQKTLELMPTAAGILVICLTVRLVVALLATVGFNKREKLFVLCAWTPKSIVEAVLCPLALNTLILGGADEADVQVMYAERMVIVTVLAIFITTPAGFLLTTYAGPKILGHNNNNDCQRTKKNDEV